MYLGVHVVGVVELGVGAGSAHRDSFEVVVVVGVQVVVSVARGGVHVVDVLAVFKLRHGGGVTLSGSVLSRVLKLGGVASSGSVLSLGRAVCDCEGD